MRTTDYLVIDLDFEAVILRIADPDLRPSDFPDGIHAFRLLTEDGESRPLEAWGLDGSCLELVYSVEEVFKYLDQA